MGVRDLKVCVIDGIRVSPNRVNKWVENDFGGDLYYNKILFYIYLTFTAPYNIIKILLYSNTCFLLYQTKNLIKNQLKPFCRTRKLVYNKTLD